MSDIRRHKPSATCGTPSQKVKDLSLDQWIYQSVGNAQARVRSQVRGNNLCILVESQPCPDAATILAELNRALAETPLSSALSPDLPPIYRVVVYGRQIGQKQPEWTESLYLNQPTQPVLSEQDRRTPAGGVRRLATGTRVDSQESVASSSMVPTLQLARLGQPDAIARYLSSVFSDLGIAVQARVEEIGRAEGAEVAEGAGLSLPSLTPRRLFVTCESAYSPDALLMADQLAQRLRELELQGFRDAIVVGQVRGEAKPEWLLRVDLTPTNDILKQWARWGDVQAITHLLNRLLSSAKIQVSAILKDVTLHLTCHSTQTATIPDKLAAIATITPTLESLSPQGIQAVTIYGAEDGPALGAQRSGSKLQPSLHWVHWLDLPAKTQSYLALPTLELAQKGSLEAIEFLVTRLLNPKLDWTLATGGIRVQVRKRADLLHLMTEAPTCPQQSQVGAAVARFLKPLQISGVAGIRIYGRRAGQKRPLWSYGVDFVTTRDRLVPEATPDFAASDVYVDDLLAPPGALVLYQGLPADDWRSILGHWLEGVIEGVQRSLIGSQLFIPAESADLTPGLSNGSEALAAQVNSRNTRVALVWGAVGLLLVVQGEWLLGQVLQPAPLKSAATPMAPPTPSSKPAPSAAPAIVQSPAGSPLPNLSLNKTKPTDGDAFNSSGFTQPGTTEINEPSPDRSDGSATEGSTSTRPISLPASPLQPKADFSEIWRDSRYPTFNSHQLDEKVALYQQYVAAHGVPKVLVIGSSRALRGVDPVALKNSLAAEGYSGVTVYNFGINGATAQVVNLIIRQILPPDKLPKLILFADGARAFNSGRVDITYNGIVASEGYKTMVAGRPPIAGTAVAMQAPAKVAPSPAPAPATPTAVAEAAPTSLSNSYQLLNQKLNQRLGALSLAYTYRDRLRTLMRDKLVAFLSSGNPLTALGIGIGPHELSDATSPAASALNSTPPVLTDGGLVDGDGFLPLPNRFNPVTYYQKYSRVTGDYDSDYESFGLEGKQTDAWLELVQFTRSHQIPLIFVNMPLTNDYLDSIRKQHEDEFQQHMLRLSTELGFTYRDLGMILANQPDYFSDPSHLNRYGAYEVSHRLAQDVMIPWQKAH